MLKSSYDYERKGKENVTQQNVKQKNEQKGKTMRKYESSKAIITH